VGSGISLENSVVSGNTGGPVGRQVDGLWLSASHCVINGTYSVGFADDVIEADPLFVDPDGADDIPGTFDDNLRIRYASPAIDAGDNARVAQDTTDLDGDGDTSEPIPLDLAFQSRFVDVLGVPDTGSGTAPIVDMGAYETPLEPLVDLATSKSNHFDDLAPGQQIAYQIYAGNLSGVDVLGAVVQDTLPENLKDCTWSCTAYDGAACEASPPEGDLSQEVDLPVGGLTEFVAVCTVASGEPEPVSNTATISSVPGAWDNFTGNNSWTDTDPVLTPGECHTYPDDRTLDGVVIMTDTVIGACGGLSVLNTEIRGVVKAAFIAGRWIAFGNGLEVPAGAQLTAELDAGLVP
jgi:uncharacterized repeat protein (TIGR01451 family)